MQAEFGVDPGRAGAHRGQLRREVAEAVGVIGIGEIVLAGLWPSSAIAIGVAMVPRAARQAIAETVVKVRMDDLPCCVCAQRISRDIPGRS
jgi:hypothetical protein